MTATWQDSLGRPASGVVRFELTAALGDTTTRALLPAPVDVSVVNGVMSFAACPVRDDPLLVYEITPKLIDGDGNPQNQRPYYVKMPYGTADVELPPKAFLSPTTPPAAPVPWRPSVPSVVPLPVGAPVPAGLPDYSVIVRY